MYKKARVLMIIGIILIVIVVVAVVSGFYLYDYHTFKTLRVCVSETQERDLMIPCESEGSCLGLIENTSEFKEHQSKIENAPHFLREKFEEVFYYSIYCDVTCKAKNVRGTSVEEIRGIEDCNPDEKEFILKINGKEGLAILSYMRALEKQERWASEN